MVVVVAGFLHHQLVVMEKLLVVDEPGTNG
jgi:hypothetical protein